VVVMVAAMSLLIMTNLMMINTIVPYQPVKDPQNTLSNAMKAISHEINTLQVCAGYVQKQRTNTAG
jgi:hypothetical protein